MARCGFCDKQTNSELNPVLQKETSSPPLAHVNNQEAESIKGEYVSTLEQSSAADFVPLTAGLIPQLNV